MNILRKMATSAVLAGVLLALVCGPASAATNLSDLELSGTLAVTGASTLSSTATITGAAALNGGITADTDAFAVADTTGIITLHGGATIDDNTDLAVLNLTETTVKVTGLFVGTSSATVDNIVCTNAATFGGGFASTGATISTAGVGDFAGALTTSAALTADNIVCTNAALFGGGFASTGATISTAGVGDFAGALTTSAALTADNIVCTNAALFGGGFASTGATISTAGVGDFAGALTTSGALTADNIVCTNAAIFGGGYASTGATISTAGVGDFAGALTSDGLITAGAGATITGVFTNKYDAAAYWTATVADGAGVTFDSVSDGTAAFAFSDPVTVSATITGTALGTVRSVIGQITASGTDIASGSIAGVRGLATLSGTITAGGSYLYGTQGKLIVSGTMNHADSRLAGLVAQLDTSAGTYTSGQISALWVDGGETSVAGTLGGQFNMVRITNTTVAVPNAVIYAYSEGSYLLDLSGPGGNANWFDTTAFGSTHLGRVKVNFNGTPGYIYVYAD